MQKISIKNILSLKNQLEKSFNETNKALLEADEALNYIENDYNDS